MKRIRNIICLVCLLCAVGSKAMEYTWTEPMPLIHLNTKFDEFAPSWNKWESKLYFNSTRNGKSQFFVADTNLNSEFINPLLFKSLINSNRENRSYISFPSKDKAILSAFRLHSKNSYLNIFCSDIIRNAWCEPYPIENFSTENFCAQASVSPDGSAMIYSTINNNKDADLFIAYKDDLGNWNTIVNLEELNSPGNEITPFFANDSLIFFASDGLGGPGGYDIYYSEKIDEMWQNPLPLIGVNSEYNESDFIMISNNRGVFASDRRGGAGNYDLYQTSRVKNNNIKINNEDPEIDLKSFVQNVRIKLKRDLTDYYPSFDIYCDESGNILNGTFPITDNSIASDFIADLSSCFKFSLNHFIDYSKENNKILKFVVYEGNLAQSIKSKLNEMYATVIGSDKIINDNNQIKKLNERIFVCGKVILEDSKEISALPFSLSNFEIEPHSIELMTDSRPQNVIEKWRYNIRVNNSNVDFIDTNAAKISFNLYEYSKDLFKADSIILTANGFYKNKSFEKQIQIDVSYSESKMTKIYDLNEQKYFKVFIHSSQNTSIDAPVLENLNKNLSKISTVIKQIDYIYYNDKMLANAENLKNSLNKFNPNYSKKNNIIKSDNASQEVIDKFIFDNIIEIRIFIK